MAMLLVRRLTSLASTLATDPALSTVALDRLMYLVTRYEHGFDQTQFDALVSQYRPEELDVVILRACGRCHRDHRKQAAGTAAPRRRVMQGAAASAL